MKASHWASLGFAAVMFLAALIVSIITPCPGC